MRRRTPNLSASGVMNEGLYASWLGLSGIPREAEAIPLERDLMLARLTGGNYHAAKISTAMAAAAIARAKADGAKVTAGVSINNLSLNENDVGEYRTFFRLSPPLRAEDDRLAMIEALSRTARSTSSSPRTTRRTSTPSACPLPTPPTARSGSKRCSARRCASTTMATCRCCGWSRSCPPPRRRLFGLPGGTLKPGAPADLAIVDLDEPWIVREATYARARRTPASRARGCRARSCKRWSRAAQSSPLEAGRTTGSEWRMTSGEAL